MKKEILLLTEWFDPEPTFKGLFFAKKLIEQGFKVRVLTGFPNYPGGKIYEGYKLRLYQKEYIDGVEIIRVPIFPSHDKSSFKRALTYFSFFLFSVLFGMFLRRPNLIYAYHPPITTGLSAIILKKIYRVPLVYDIQDLWPDTLHSTGMINNRHLLNFINIFCNLVYKTANHVVVLSDGFKLKLQERGIPKNKISVIYNWCNESKLLEGLDDSLIETSNNKFNIIFTGNIGKAQGLNNLLKAAEALLESTPNIHFTLYGDGLEFYEIENKISSMNLKNISIHRAVPMNKIGKFIHNADAFLVHLINDPLFEITIPSKTQVGMFFGRPIIMSVSGDAAKIVKNANCGYTVKPENTGDLIATLKVIASENKKKLRSLGNNGKKYYEENFSIDSGVKKFSSLFNSLIN